jgi:hypothetical protein
MANNTIIPDGSISGNKISGGVITNFQSTGIQDLATTTSLIVSNGAITVPAINVKQLLNNVEVTGNLTVDGTITIAENVNFNKDLNIAGNIMANTITVREIIADVRQETLSPITFTGFVQSDLNGKGLQWKLGGVVSNYLIFSNGRLSSNIELDLQADQSYYIGGSPVISSGGLGANVVNSSLRTVGTLQSLKVSGPSEFDGSVVFNGAITAQTITANQVITSSGAAFEIGTFSADTDQQLNGQGIHWRTHTADNMLVYRQGGRIWTNANFDIAVGSTYKINNNDVLTQDALGSGVTKSNLQQLGKLTELAVSGDTSIADFAFFNSTYNRLGIGNEDPAAAIDILENNVNIIIGSPATNLGHVGTYSSHDFAIVTDNMARITIKNTGDVVVPGNLTINGVLTVSNIVSDSRIDRTHPLEFSATRDGSIYGLGFLWSGTGYTRQLIMMGGPDRLYTTESFDLAENQSYYINGKTVLSETSLGAGVVRSNLSTVGTLSNLTVSGHAVLSGGVDASQSDVTVKTLTFNDGVNSLNFAGNVINSNSSVGIEVQNTNIVYGDDKQISIGDKNLQTKPIKVFGKLSVGINNPDPTVNFSVNGDVNIGGKRFTSDASVPTSGSYQMGDICWNTAPQSNSYIGWVCVVAGTPGQWYGFGQIANQ